MAAAEDRCAFPGCAVPGSLVCPQCQTEGLPDFHVCSNEHLHALWAEHYTAVHLPRIEQAAAAPAKVEQLVSPKAVVMAGDLMKKPGKGLLKLWQSRYFVLYPDLLVWFKDRKAAAAAEPQGCVPMFAVKFAHVVENQKGADPGRFDVTTGEVKTTRIFELQAADNMSAQKWCEAVNKCKKIAAGTVTKAQLDEMTEDTFWKKHLDKITAELQKRAKKN